MVTKGNKALKMQVLDKDKSKGIISPHEQNWYHRESFFRERYKKIIKRGNM
jgi:hypothetical protein